LTRTRAPWAVAVRAATAAKREDGKMAMMLVSQASESCWRC
jgi:hypothetical protein